MKWSRFRLTKPRKVPLKDRIIIFYTAAIRRPFYNIFRKEYIKNQLKKRKGKCNQCGKCCEVMDILALKCKYLRDGKCTVFEENYNTHEKCDIYQYPFDEKDMVITKKYANCGFYWK